MNKELKREFKEKLQQRRELSRIEETVGEVKEAIFSVFYLLLQQPTESQSRLLVLLKLSLDYLQTIGFVFHSKVLGVWRSTGIFSALAAFSDLFNVSHFFSQFLGPTVYLVCFYALTLLILLIVTNFAYVAYSFKRKEFRVLWPLLCLQHFASTALTVLFLPIVSVLISIVG